MTNRRLALLIAIAAFIAGMLSAHALVSADCPAGTVAVEGPAICDIPASN